MSDHAAASAGSHGGDDIHGSPSPSFMQKNRLKLIIAGGFFGFLFVLIVGIAIGMTKRNFERTQYIEQIARLKVSFEETIETRKELEEKISELKKEVKEKKIEVEELEVKVEDLERRGGAKAGGSEHAAPAAHGEAPKEGADIKPAGGGYVKFGGGDCVLPAGGGKGNAAWKECIKQNSNAKPEAPKAEAAPAKEPAGH